MILHAAVIALVLLSRAQAPIGRSSGLAAFDIANGADRLRIAQPVRRHRAKALSKPNPIPPPAIDAASAILPAVAALPVIGPVTGPAVDIQPVSFAAGAGCDLTQPAQDALRRSVELNRHLPDIPADRRSIANAIVVWNAGWMEPGTAPAQAAFAAIRQTITQTVLAASAECRNQIQVGPRLIYLPGDAGKTTVLALGSGSWTWQQVADGVPPPAVTDPGRLATGPSVLTPADARFATPRAAAPSSETPDLRAFLATLVRKRSSTGLPYNP